MNSPSVSVIIPAYNHGRFINRSVDSALSQTCRSLEVIVVDDGSTDDVRELVGRYGAAVRYHWRPNGGLSAARNTGLTLAIGEFVQFLDADDTIAPEKIETQLDHLLRNPAADLVYSDYSVIDNGRKKVKIVEDPPATQIELVRRYCRYNLTPVHSPLIRRRVFEHEGGFEDSRAAQEDWDFWMRLATRGYRFDYVPGVFANYHRDGSEITNNPELMYKRGLHLLEKYQSDERLLSFGEAVRREFIYFQNVYIGNTSYLHGCWTRARQHLLKALAAGREGIEGAEKKRELWTLIAKTYAHQIVDWLDGVDNNAPRIRQRHGMLNQLACMLNQRSSAILDKLRAGADSRLATEDENAP